MNLSSLGDCGDGRCLSGRALLLSRLPFVLVMIAAMFSALLCNAAPRPMSIDDLYEIKNVTALALSPDGKQLAYLSEIPRGRLDSLHQELWLMDIQSWTTTRVSAGKAIYNVQWSPDGATLSYFSLREDEQQMHLYELSSSEERSLLATSVNQANGLLEVFMCHWAPSGRELACIVRPKSRYDAVEGHPSRTPKSLTMGDSQELSMKRARFLREDYFLAIVDASTGRSRQITHGAIKPSLNSHSVDWAPDGKSLLFIGYDKPLLDVYDSIRESDVFSANLETGELRNLGGTAGADSQPFWSANGREVFFYGNGSRDVYASGQTGIRRLDVLSGKTTTLFSGRVTDLRLLGSRDQLLGKRRSHGNEQLFTISTTSGQVRQLTPTDMTVIDYSVAKDGSTVAMILSSASKLPEIYLGAVRGGSFRQISDLYAEERANFVCSSGTGELA